MRKQLWFLSLLPLFLATPAVAGSKSGADFLKIPIGAQAIAMGQAYSAMASGVNALNWNPAGMARVPGYAGGSASGFSFSHQALFQDSSLDHVALITPNRFLANRMSFGMSIVRLDNGEQHARGPNREKTGSLNSSDISVGGAFAFNMGSWNWGSQVKYIRQELAEFHAQGMALDLGFQSRTPINKLSIGGSVRNMGPRMQFIEERFNLPLTLSVGAAVQVIGPLTVGLDVYNRPHQKETAMAIGSEFNTLGSVSLRAGYLAQLATAITNNQTDETNRGSVGGLNGLTGGIGLQYNSFSLDYAISQFGELGFTHSFTVATWFGGVNNVSVSSGDISEFEEMDFIVPEGAFTSRTIVIFVKPVNPIKWWQD